MRLAGEAKAGFYPTPELVARRIRSCLQSTGPSSLVDPCCGRGEALELIAQSFRGAVHGVELEQERAEAARERLDLVLQGDSLSTRVRGKYGLLYLNPPYHQAEGQRLELRFLWYWQRYLTPGGVLIYVVPEAYLPEYSKTLSANFENISIYRFPGETYEAFGQVVVFGTKRQHVGNAGTLPKVAGELEVRSVTYPVPSQDELPEPYLTDQDPKALVAEAHASRLWERVWDAITPQALDSFPVPMPLRQGHIAQMLAGGMLNNTVVTGQGRRLLVRGRISKRLIHTETEQDDGSVKVSEREVLESTVTALDLDSAELITLK